MEVTMTRSEGIRGGEQNLGGVFEFATPFIILL